MSQYTRPNETGPLISQRIQPFPSATRQRIGGLDMSQGYETIQLCPFAFLGTSLPNNVVRENALRGYWRGLAREGARHAQFRGERSEARTV